jgi:hypothetical protein
MRRRSVADRLAADRRASDRALSPSERVARALALGRRDLELYAAVAGLSMAAARRAVERRRQARRRASQALATLVT